MRTPPPSTRPLVVISERQQKTLPNPNLNTSSIDSLISRLNDVHGKKPPQHHYTYYLHKSIKSDPNMLHEILLKNETLALDKKLKPEIFEYIPSPK